MVAAEALRLPRDRSEGDVPAIAVTTGDADALECLIRKLGISDSEIGTVASDARVHLFAGNGANHFSATAPHQGSFPDARELWDRPESLARYDIVVLSCEGAQRPWTKSQAAMEALKSYADLGGRVYMSHWHNIWLGGERGYPAHGLPAWQAIAEFDFGAAQHEQTQTAIVDTAGPQGLAFATWMRHVGAIGARDELVVNEPRYTATRLVNPAAAQTWLYVDPERSVPRGKRSVQDFTFTTPVGAPPADRCGKVVFSDMHVSADSESHASTPFLAACAPGDLTPQEKALAYIFFDMARCISPIL